MALCSGLALVHGQRISEQGFSCWSHDSRLRSVIARTKMRRALNGKPPLAEDHPIRQAERMLDRKQADFVPDIPTTMAYIQSFVRSERKKLRHAEP